MSTERVRIAIAVDDAALAERLAAMLGGVEGIEIATPGEEAHASLVAGERRAADSRSASMCRSASAKRRRRMALPARK